MNVAELIVKYIEDIGVKHVFYIPGGPIIPLSEALWNSSQIELICTSHECGAAFMAHGYAWCSDTLGVCCVTSGPGTTNAITGVATAKLDQVPLLIITAMNSLKCFSKKPTQDSTPYDGIDTVGIYEKCTYYSKMLTHPEEASYVIQNAIKIALIKRGPVHVSVPTDVGFQEVPSSCHIFKPHQYIPTLPKLAEQQQIDQVVKIVSRAQKPLLFIGYEVIANKAFDEIKKLAELLSIPVITTAKAKGAFPEEHPLSLGVYGFSSSYQAINYLNKKHDVLLSVGVDFHENATETWSDILQPSQTLVHIGTEPLHYGHCYAGDIGLIGDAGKIIAAINAKLCDLPLSQDTIYKRDRSTAQLKSEISRFRDPEKMVSQSSPIKPQRLIMDLQTSFPAETIYVVDVGGAFLWANHFLTLNRSRTFLISTRYAPMGFSIAAIGCKCACPQYPVVAFIGDGAVKMHGMEIATAVNNKLPVIFVVLNDAQWGAVEFGYALLGIKADVAKFRRVNCAKLAEALGATGFTITKPGEINKQFVDELLASNTPVVLDIHVDTSECPPFGSRIEGLNSNKSENDEVKESQVIHESV